MSTPTDRALKGWHPGELAVQEIMHLPARVSITAVVNHLPDQHRLFHTTRLHFLPITTLDDQGRPWASVLTPADQTNAFISSPDGTHLQISARLWDGEPIVRNLAESRMRCPKERILVSALGIEVATRRRNKFAGYVDDVSLNERSMVLKLVVNQALGLCPKYINVRQVFPHPDTHPRVTYQRLGMSPEERLPPDIVTFIQTADTSFLATSYVAPPELQTDYPSHVGINHRGGRPGFIRVRPSDGRTVVLPNYAGNRLLNSLGNIHVTPLAGLTIPSFSNGSILYITGKAETFFGTPAQDIMPLMNVLTTIYVTGYVLVEDALSIRETPGILAERSAYSPPVRYLAEEKPPDTTYDDISVSLIRARIHCETLITLVFEASRQVEIAPSQNVVLDLSGFIRTHSHTLLDWIENGTTANDDCVRTWTVSTPPTPTSPRQFSITMRVIAGGLITPILYRILSQYSSGRDVVQLAPLDITARLRGIGGSLPVPVPVAACDGGRQLLWIAGGIGVTPFLSLTRHVAQHVVRTFGVWDIVLVISTREPDIMIGLISDALEALKETATPSDLSFIVHMFSPIPPTVPELLPSFVKLRQHPGRVSAQGDFFGTLGAKEREAHICGPLPFVQTAMRALELAGVDPESVKRERFTY